MTLPVSELCAHQDAASKVTIHGSQLEIGTRTWTDPQADSGVPS